ncbi:MAG: TonB-dependent receptor [Balneolaceae bacterium]|nr:MAG: TonB-dependent receptor [Balneolaceae bacterium]
MNRLYTHLLLLCMVFLAVDQAGATPATTTTDEVTGVVISSDDGKPVSGATVRAQPCSRATATDHEGRFTLNLKGCEQPQEVRISFIGYRTLTHSLTETDRSREMEFILYPVVETLSPVTVLSYRTLRSPSMELETARSALLPVDSGAFLREASNASGIRRGGFGIDPVLRGLSGSRLNVRVDGLTTTAAACPNRMDPPTSHIRLTDIERIEIHRGPHALEYGPAFGGTLNFVSQKPDEYVTPRLNADFRAGLETNTAHRKTDLRIFGGNRRVDFILNGGLSSTGDYISGSGVAIPAGFGSRDYGLELGWNLTREQRFTAAWSQSFVRDADFPSLPMDMAVDDTYKLKAGYSWRPSEGQGFQQLELNGYWSLVDHEMNNHRRSSFGMRDAVALAETQTRGVHARASGLLPSGRWTVAGGTDHQDVSGTRFVEFKTGPRTGEKITYNLWQDASITNIGIYSGMEQFLADWTLSAGVRADLNLASSDDAAPRFAGQDLDSDHLNFSISGGVTRSLSSGNTLGLFLGRGVRSPDITERYINFLTIGRDGFEYAGNPALEPEENLQADLVWQLRTDRYRFGATLFGSHMTNYISAVADPDTPPVAMDVPGVRVFTNRGDARFAGFELEGEAGFEKGWFLGASLAYTHASYREDGTAVAEIPPLEAGITAGGLLFSGRLTHETKLRYVFEQGRIDEAFGESKTPAFFLADINLRSELRDGIMLSAGVRNLFDEAYYEHLNRRFNPGIESASEMLLEPGRRIYLELSIRI